MTEKLNIILPEPSGADFGYPGWLYRDVPRMSPEFFEKFNSIVGDDNIIWLTQAVYRSPKGDAIRGQALISPEGLQNIGKYKDD